MFTHTLTCPYCYESFGQSEIWFRCTGRPSRHGKKCSLERDQLLEQRVGVAVPLPPAFAVNGRKMKAACPGCGGETTYCVCPACHSQLPVHFGKVKSQLVAMVGAKETGKSVYLTVLIHELMHQVGTRFNASVVGCDDSTRARFSDQRARLYDSGQLLDATRSAQAAGGVVAPLVFRLTSSRNGKGRAAPEQNLFSFFDTAGEDLNSQTSVEQNTRYLASADGIILLLDPLQMPGARALAKPGTRLPSQATLAERPENVLSRITDLLQAQLNRPNARIKTPIAVAFSKLDALRHDFPSGSPLRRPPSTASAFDSQDSLDVHAYIQSLLHEWGGEQIDRMLSNQYARYRYFGVSSLGEPPTADDRVAPSGIQPYRVPDPFLWLLSEFGAVPATKV